MPQIDLSILNQRQTPAFYADTLANRPAAGFIGRIFVSTNTFELYRDNGTGWDLIGGPGAGTVTGSGAAGQVAFWNAASTITGSNDLFWDNVNGHLGIGTITPGTALDVKHDQNTVVQLEQSVATNDNRIAFINNGVGLWRLGAFYNAGANDFGLFDIVNSAARVTIKNTGQTFIGPQQSSSGKLVVVATARDNGIILIGTDAPGFRINDGTEARQVGIALSTGNNDFIQNSVSRDFCIFNASKPTASPILFGIHDATPNFVIEAARISAARNLLVGQTTDSGERLIISGVSRFNGNITTNSSFIDIGTSSKQAFLYSDTGSGYAINMAANNLGSGSTSPYGRIFFSNNVAGTLTVNGNIGCYADSSPDSGQLLFYTKASGGSNTLKLAIKSNGNVLIGGSVDSGQLLQVNGSALTNQYLITPNGTTAVYNIVNGTNTYAGLYIMQAGGGSAGFGGSITAYGHSHATKPGWVEAGISALSGGRFIVNSTANASGGSQLFSVKQDGQVNIPIIQTFATNALAIAGGLVVGDLYRSATGVLSIVF